MNQFQTEILLIFKMEYKIYYFKEPILYTPFIYKITLHYLHMPCSISQFIAVHNITPIFKSLRPKFTLRRFVYSGLFRLFPRAVARWEIRRGGTIIGHLEDNDNDILNSI